MASPWWTGTPPAARLLQERKNLRDVLLVAGAVQRDAGGAQDDRAVQRAAVACGAGSGPRLRLRRERVRQAIGTGHALGYRIAGLTGLGDGLRPPIAPCASAQCRRTGMPPRRLPPSMESRPVWPCAERFPRRVSPPATPGKMLPAFPPRRPGTTAPAEAPYARPVWRRNAGIVRHAS